ncbi:MAG: hypothetical protein AAGA27_05285 [Pseudomonadota bacterium]
MASDYHIPPRIIRLKDVPAYLGMSRKYFNQHVRPQLPCIRIGSRGIGFDVLDLDNWLSYGKHGNGISATKALRRNSLWQKRKSQVSTGAVESGTLINVFSDNGFAKVLARHLSKKLNSTSRTGSKH